MRYFWIIVILLLPLNISFSQNKQEFITDKINGINIDLSFEQQNYSIDLIDNKNTITYTNSLDESNAGKPSLPSKTFFIAIPPLSNVNVRLENPVYSYIKDVETALNPGIQLNNDSSISLKKANPDLNSFATDEYPSIGIEVIGYTWLRDYYCAVVKVNTHIYNWKKKEVRELISVTLKTDFIDVKPFNINSNPVGDFDKMLEEIIVNYSSAQKYRSSNLSSISADTTGGWIDYTSEYVKLGIANDGIYRIYYSDLVSYGLNPSVINPKTIKIFIKGNQIPIYVKGESDLIFDQVDYIEFWAEKNYNKNDYRKIVAKGTDYINFMDIYSDTTVAWLSWNNAEGIRTKEQNSFNTGLADTVKSHLVKLHFEKYNLPLSYYYDGATPQSQLPFWQEHKVWLWQVISSNSIYTIPFEVKNVVPDLQFKTYGRLISYAISNTSLTHKFAAGLNSLPSQDTTVFNYRQTINLSSTFNSNILNNGINNYKIYGIPTQAANHTALLDWVDIDYFRYNVASNDSLKILIDPSLNSKERIIEIKNFNSADSLILITKVNNGIKRILNFRRAGSSIYFSDTVKGGDVYFVIKSSFIKSPKFYEKKQFANLRDVSKGADYILITNKNFNQSSTNYFNFIQNNYNARSQYVLINDIYDEFGYGYPEADAVKRFIEYTHTFWQAPKPSYLTLIGDANYDYRNIVNSPNKKRYNYVPSYGSPVSDVWFTTLDKSNVNIPQMFVGRIPAENNEQIDFYLQKHRTYLGRGYDDWNKSYLFFSGGETSNSSELQQIYNANHNIFNNLVKPIPTGGVGIHFYKTKTPPSNFGPYTQSQIDATFDNGGIFISYIGHSGTRTWDNGIEDVSDLKNIYSNRLPLISDFGCSTGKFAEPDGDAFGELFTTGDKNGQAICYLGNSSWGYLSTSLNFGNLFYKNLLIDSVLSIGRAHILSKIRQLTQFGFSDASRVFNYCNILFGDPIISFQLPLKVNFVMKPNSISIEEDDVNNLTDSVSVKLYIQNFGKVTGDSVEVSFTENYNGETVYLKEFKVRVPFNKDSIFIKIPINQRIGIHTISVELDKSNKYDEIYENDNSSQFQFNVFSTALKPIEVEDYYNTSMTEIHLINPLKKIDIAPEEVSFSFSDNAEFTNQQIWTVPFDTIKTTVKIQSFLNNKRYWWRAKMNSSNFDYSHPYSFRMMENKYSWFIDNSFRHGDVQYLNTRFDSSSASWVLPVPENILRVSSAGSNDGESGTIYLNQTQILPSTFFWGIATAIIDTVTLTPGKIKYFVFKTNDQTTADSMRVYLDIQPDGTTVAMTICADAWDPIFSQSNANLLKQTLKNYGSTKADSIKYRDSWSFIGRKGAVPGTVFESFKKRYTGVASVQTKVKLKPGEGNLVFPVIGKTSGWNKVFINDSIPAGTDIQIIPLGLKKNKQVDTLSTLVFNGDSASIANIDADIYPEIKLLVKLKSDVIAVSPQLKSVGVNFKAPPELAINYQVVDITPDSVYQGNSAKIKFAVYNVGKSYADSFNVKLELIKPDNTKRIIFDSTIVSLGTDKSIPFEINYLSNNYDGYGNMVLNINIDEQKKQLEIFEDNNIFELPFFIIKDTTTSSVTDKNITALFDDNEIFDGDFVSSNPQVTVKLNYPIWFPIEDTTAVEFYLNTNRISRRQFDTDYDTVNRLATYKFNPRLSDGEYSFRIYGIDESGKLEEQPGYQKSFIVSEHLKASELYNYPNPFSDKTSFTFKLSQKPDELKIKIYTVAGRLIKEISRNSDQLKTDFNKIDWDGKDEDGDIVANGIYIYKLIVKNSEEEQTLTQKMAIAR